MLLLCRVRKKSFDQQHCTDVYLELVRDLPDVVEIQVLQYLDFGELVQFVEVGGGDEVGGGRLGALGGGARGGGVLQAEGCQGRKARVHLARRRKSVRV